ncbi:insulinase family protein [Salinimonas lutimaris]|uniref:insulinase family protein n=1 Tax=Salinimonas lutimaris TaxID=914153 RepID=UPI001E3F5241|nr:insulinase family protein [Salinimonas lutimaris]
MTTLNFFDATYLTLPNGLKVMLCPTEGTTSFVSMSVKAGHFYDPENCQGLAHLLEHALFLGSQHLPKPNSINDLVERHGGAINAWTAAEYANYHFQCPGEALSTLLPAFADMLRRPLLNKQALVKEIQSIDAEFHFKRKDDLRRLYQIHKETCNPAHPFAKFSVGNAQIFNAIGDEALRGMLAGFHQQYYCAANMTMCIFTANPIDDVRQLVEKGFGSVEQGQQATADWPAMYLDEQKGVQINIVPLQSARRMIVTFPLPGLHNDYRVKPLNYFSHLLGDEGEGSLLAFLKAHNWVTNLIAGSGIEGDDYKDFNISFQLTREGLNHREHILYALFAYLKLLEQSLEEPWRYHEKSRLNDLAFQFEETPKLLPLACEYAQHLFLYDFDEIPFLRVSDNGFDKAVLQASLAHFSAHAIRVKTIAPGLPVDRQCKHYDAHYSITPFDTEFLDSVAQAEPIEGMFLPPPNPYLGSEYELTMQVPAYSKPQNLIAKAGLNCWFAQDHDFASPKGDIYFSFDTRGFTDSLPAVGAKRIWLACLNDELQAKYYRAEIAGLHYRLYGHQAGFSLHTRGFTNQQMLLATQLFEAIQTIRPSQEQFEMRKAMQLQNLQNALLNKPTNRLFSRLSVLIQRNTQAPVDLIKAVEQCTYEDMLTYADAALAEFYLETLMHGNWSPQEATAFARQIEQQAPNAVSSPLSRQVSLLPTGKTLVHQVPSEHEDAAVVLYLQAPSNSDHDTIMCMVLEQMLSAPFFNALRTQKQLGYVVGTGYVPHNQHPGMSFYVQSPTHSPEQLLDEITRFLFEQLKDIDFYQVYWNNIRQNLLKQLEDKDLSLSMKSQRLWISLGTEDYHFDRNLRLAAMIENLEFDQISAYADKLANRELFGELVLFAQGKFDDATFPSGLRVDDITAFKELTPGH